MPVQIEVAHGPDAGWAYVLTGPEVRVGRGAGNQVRVTDPAWSDGYLTVRAHPGGCSVTNHLPHPVFLDSDVLAETETRTWFVGGRLQPTAGTVMVLGLAADPLGPSPPAGVVAVPPGKRRRVGFKWEYAALAALAVAWAWLLWPEGGPPPVAALAANWEQVNTNLDAVSPSAPFAADVDRGRKNLSWAVTYESWGHRSHALVKYQAAAAAFARASKRTKADEPDGRAVAAAHAYAVGRQVAVTAP